MRKGFYNFFISLFGILGVSSFNLYAQVSDFPSISYHKADSQALAFQGYPYSNLLELSNNLTAGLKTEVERFRAIYKWVCNNIENDYNLYAVNKRNRERYNDNPIELEKWNAEITQQVFKILRKDNRTVCTGYAYLIKELAYFSGIECKIIDGYGRTPVANIGGKGISNHSWNAVRLRDKWYLCDATWSSGSIDETSKSFIKKYKDEYFLADPSLFGRNHYPLDTSWLLLDNPISLQDFLNAPLIYPGTYWSKIIPLNPNSFYLSVEKGGEVEFQFQSLDNTEIPFMVIQLTQSFNLVHQQKTILRKVGDDENSLTYRFKRKGVYALHFLIEGEYIATYEVRVGKG